MERVLLPSACYLTQAGETSERDHRIQTTSQEKRKAFFYLIPLNKMSREKRDPADNTESIIRKKLKKSFFLSKKLNILFYSTLFPLGESDICVISIRRDEPENPPGTSWNVV